MPPQASMAPLGASPVQHRSGRRRAQKGSPLLLTFGKKVASVYLVVWISLSLNLNCLTLASPWLTPKVRNRGGPSSAGGLQHPAMPATTTAQPHGQARDSRGRPGPGLRKA